jgi:FtsP/CotA-like multicopper oxidase with cupredoxin domain
VPDDPSGHHPPGELVSTTTTAGGEDPPPEGDLGDGTVLAPFTDVDGVKEFHLTMAETTIEVSPGVVKQAYAFNGIVPGPVLRVNEGDRVRIVVDNDLPFPTSTHWHGMILPNDQDGVGGITQPHIEPGEQYVYEWTAVATGTHWYHAHSSGRHIGKGLYGPLEVVPDQDDIESDRDYRLMLGDTDLGFTLNGRSFPSTPTLAAEVGETVRLRLINTGDQVHAMHLHGVPFKVVAQDGMPRVQPESMDTLTISPGQTFDLTFTQQYPGKWLIHCHMFVHSHMSADEHPPGESGMNGMVSVLEVSPASGGGDLELLPISAVRSDPELVAVGVVGGLGVLAAARRRRRRRSLLPIQQS